MGGSYWVKDRVEWNWGACGGRGVPNATSCGSYVSLAGLTDQVLRLWPDDVPTYFVSFDIGFWVRSGGVLKNGAPERSPCRQAYMDFCGVTGGSGGLPEWCDARGRNAWDLMAVVLAVRGKGRFYKLFPGINRVDVPSGRNTWSDLDPWEPREDWGSAAFGHYQAWLPDRTADGGEAYNATADEIDELLLQLPLTTPPPVPPIPASPPPSPPPSSTLLSAPPPLPPPPPTLPPPAPVTATEMAASASSTLPQHHTHFWDAANRAITFAVGGVLVAVGLWCIVYLHRQATALTSMEGALQRKALSPRQRQPQPLSPQKGKGGEDGIGNPLIDREEIFEL